MSSSTQLDSRVIISSKFISGDNNLPVCQVSIPSYISLKDSEGLGEICTGIHRQQLSFLADSLVLTKTTYLKIIRNDLKNCANILN